MFRSSIFLNKLRQLKYSTLSISCFDRIGGSCVSGVGCSRIGRLPNLSSSRLSCGIIRRGSLGRPDPAPSPSVFGSQFLPTVGGVGPAEPCRFPWVPRPLRLTSARGGGAVVVPVYPMCWDLGLPAVVDVPLPLPLLAGFRVVAVPFL